MAFTEYRATLAEVLAKTFERNFSTIETSDAERESGLEVLLLLASVQRTTAIKFHAILTYEGQEMAEGIGETEARTVQKQSTIYTYIRDMKEVNKQLIEEEIGEMCERIYDAFLRNPELTDSGFWEALAKPATAVSSTAGTTVETQAPASNSQKDLGRRTALVIGNAAYRRAPLENPINDAVDMAKVLKSLGFSVTTLLNASQQEMWDAIRRFGDELINGGVGLFYFAGHGIQVDGINYLIPLDAQIQAEEEVRFKAVDAGIVLAKMERANNETNLVILDSCRDNPFKRSFRSASRGLAIMEAPRGSLIVYATAPGSVAGEGSGRNGIFTSAFLKHLNSPGLEVEQMLKLVRRDVMKETRDSQIPWSSSSLMGEFFFASKGP